MDAPGRARCQDHIRLARPAVQTLRSANLAPGPDPRRGAGGALAPRLHGAVAHRLVGTQPSQPEDQAVAWQRRSGRLGLLIDGLHDRRRLGRRGSLPDAAQAVLGAGHPPQLGHGAEPHGHRLALGHGASGLVPAAARLAVPLLLVHRRQPLGRRAGHDPDRGPLLGLNRCCRSVQEDRQLDRRRHLHLPRQRRHEHALERHGPTRLPQAGGPRGRHPDHPARRHIQRLWYPEPGQGGAIPSRAEHATTRAAFDEHMPAEFWREVVDRVAAEVPDTLLLAEAFWLLEGYCVRTLGMHRVYNSAFMNMLRDEENASYRRVMKDTIEFDPEVLKRFVNFMSNPDERTAVDQFGKGDKYFGVATVMATMPGLPMIGHGQVEGFAEKYGMEYRRAYRDEKPDGWLVERHEREIFPLFHRRALFADVTDFLLYDVFDPGGWVNEDIFAYSNSHGEERGLVVYHNRFAETKGWIKTSSAYSCLLYPSDATDE